MHFSHTKEIAEKEWLGAYTRHYPRKSNRLPEPTSLNRYMHIHIDPTHICNVDETGNSTVTQPTKSYPLEGKCELPLL